MQLDVIDLKDFYTRPLGLVVRSLLSPRIRARWSEVKGMRVFGLGFTTPYLAPFRGEASVLGALMPAELGAVPWPEQGQSVSALVEETELPLDDESADRILLVHMLEWSEKSRALLRELWRVLAPERPAPPRRSQPKGLVGARRYHAVRLWQPVQPLAADRSCSRRLCSRRRSGNTRSICRPSIGRVLLKWPLFWERLGLVLWPAFSGVILVEATKQVYAAVPARAVERKVKRRIVPVPAGITPQTGASSFETGLRPSSG